jgi:AAT family amino acid transporter
VATVAVLWVWGMVSVTHLRYRAEVNAGRLPSQSFRLPGSPWTNFAVLAFILLVVVLLFVTPDQHIALIAGGVWAVLLGAGWLFVARRSAERSATPAPEAEAGPEPA